MIRFLLAALLALPGAHVLAEEDEHLSWNGVDWLVFEAPERGRVEAGRHDGRDALYLRRAQVWLEGLVLGDAVLEFDVQPVMQSGFIGINFRAQEDGNMEQFYVRGHQSGSDDATQYQPIHNGLSSWQIHAGPNDIQAVDIEAGAWLPVRIVVIGDAADIFVGDLETPLLHVADLKGTTREGQVGFFMSDRPWIDGSGAWFSNVRFRPSTAEDRLVGEPREEPEPPPGLIRQWQVSASLAEATLLDGHTLPALELDWRSAGVETNGIVNLGRLGAPMADADTVLVRALIDGGDGTVKRLRFGYSDRVRLYLNGEEIYAGDAAWRSRDHRHLGTITWVDSVPLRLRPGENQLVAAVTEGFGGWGFTGALED
jgi:hypothetical protein